MTEEWWGRAGEVKGWTGHQLMSVYSTPKQLSLAVTTQSLGCDWHGLGFCKLPGFGNAACGKGQEFLCNLEGLTS